MKLRDMYGYPVETIRGRRITNIIRYLLHTDIVQTWRRRHKKAEAYCRCGECTPKALHASDCSVHNEPALPKGECDCEPIDPRTEILARDLHEAGREAVMSGATVGHSTLGEVARGFREWHEITEEAREGRRIQARWLLERYAIAKKKENLNHE